MNLGPENGLDVLDGNAKAQFRNLPVVMFTAQGSVKTAVEAMRRGAVDFLEKPFQPRAIPDRCSRACSGFHQMSQRIERLEQEVTETNAQSPETHF